MPNAVSDFEAEIDENLEAIRAFKRGENTLVVHTYRPLASVATIRERLGLSQMEFAGRLSVSVRTVQDWEQGRRGPRGPAKMLLRIAELEPEVFLSVWDKIRITTRPTKNATHT